MSALNTGSVTRKGFTMIEVVIGLFLIVMVMAGGYLLIVRSSELSRAARNQYIAVTLCKNRLERARNFDLIDLHLLAEQDLVVDDNGAPAAGGTFARTTVVNTNIAPGLVEVKVTVKVRNKRTGSFGAQQAQETMDMKFTTYLVPPTP